MTKVLILGAHGQIARVATDLFLRDTVVGLTLHLRNARRLRARADDPRVRVPEGDVLDEAVLTAAMDGRDVVYANLSGSMERQAQAIVRAMKAAAVRRLIFIASMGIYDEVPGERYGGILDPYRKATAVIEPSELDYTVLRPAWLDDRNAVAYGTTRKGEPFANATATVSRRSVADLVVRTATTPGLHSCESLGVHGTA